jgi:hypothetical protein
MRFSTESTRNRKRLMPGQSFDTTGIQKMSRTDSFRLARRSGRINTQLHQNSSVAFSSDKRASRELSIEVEKPTSGY